MEKNLDYNRARDGLDTRPSIPEGSTVTLDASDFVKFGALSNNADISYVWTLKSGPPITNLVDEKTKKPSFKVPYLEDNDRLSAELVFSIILSNFKENKSFDGSVERVRKFWELQMIPTFADFADLNPVYRSWWDHMHSSNKIIKQSWNNVLTGYCSSLDSDSNPDWIWKRSI